MKLRRRDVVKELLRERKDLLVVAGLGSTTWDITAAGDAPLSFPTWGAMLSGSGRTYMIQAPWMAVFPGIAISLAVFGFNMLGDALRDVLDPRLRGAGGGALRG